MCVRLINAPSFPGCAAVSVLREQNQEVLTESDSRRGSVLIRSVDGRICSGANRSAYSAADCQAVLWKSEAV